MALNRLRCAKFFHYGAGLLKNTDFDETYCHAFRLPPHLPHRWPTPRPQSWFSPAFGYCHLGLSAVVCGVAWVFAQSVQLQVSGKTLVRELAVFEEGFRFAPVAGE